MSIQPKKGKCIDCPPESGDVPLIAKRCKNHYWKHRKAVNAQKPEKGQKEAQGAALSVFFASQALIMPLNCEETGQLLPTRPAWMRRACIAHILKKRPDFGFPSVATHPMNKVFLHPDIHNAFDNKGEAYIKNMKVFPRLKERVKILLPFLTPEELNRVPDYYL